MPFHPGLLIGKHSAASALLLHCEGANGSTTITDSTGRHVVSARGASISTTRSKFGTSSLLLNGTSFISTPDHADFNPAGDFTLDFWVWLNDISKDYALMSKTSPTGFGMTLYMFHGSLGSGFAPFIENLLSSNGTSDFHEGGMSTPSPTGAWHHVAQVRSGNTYMLAWDGVFGDSFSHPNPINSGTGELAFGAYDIGGTAQAAPALLDGFMDEIRWVNAAMWTANFTPPVAPYTS